MIYNPWFGIYPSSWLYFNIAATQLDLIPNQGFSMPELPEVEAFKKYVKCTSLNKKIDSVDILNAKVLDGISVDFLKEILYATVFKDAFRWGKHLFICLENGFITMHFGMTGSLLYYNSVSDEPLKSRVIFSFEDGGFLSFIDLRLFGRIGYTKRIREYLRKHHLGIDALHIRKNQFVSLIRNKTVPLKTFLMDQTILSGIGNEYSDEIAYQSHLHPLNKCNRLNNSQIESLFSALYYVLNLAVSLPDKSRLPDDFLIKNRGSQQQCNRCDNVIKKIQISGRTSYFCPFCQKLL